LLLLPPIVLGAGFLALQVSERAAPEQAAPVEVARPVRVIEVRPSDYLPRALGYGYVQPGKVWEAVSEVAGKIVYRHPDLERGRVLQAGTVILRIDPTDYELATVRIASALESAAAQLAELDIREANTKALVEIERRALALTANDLERKRALQQKGNASQASVDQAENAVLGRKQKLQELENQLRLVPAERRVVQADRALQRAQLREAELDIERTEVRLPFDARIAEVTVEAQQYVGVNQNLATGDSIDVAEVSAQVAIEQVRPLIPPGFAVDALATSDLSVAPRRWGLTAKLRLRSGDLVASWDARFDRMSETIDPQTRTIGFIVAVDAPYGHVIPGKRPPLVKNLYVEVELRAPPRPGRIVVPRDAIHRADDGSRVVYLADQSDRLVMVPVELGAV
jgi:multidrug efflux pump subunit AcrA (membrane-fusion protein)